MTQHNPWAGDGTQPEAEDVPAERVVTMADIERMPTLDEQLAALNGGPVATMSVEELHVLQGIAGAWAITRGANGLKPHDCILRSLLEAGFQAMRPFATAEQEALGTVDTTLPN